MKKITLLALILFFFAKMSLAGEVNVFSARHYDSDIQLYKKFTNKTGIKVNVVSGKDKALQKRITEEGKDSKADLYITADAGRLGAFDAKGMFQNSMSAQIEASVPANFRSDNWTGIAKRARIIYYSPERVSSKDLKGITYESLSDPKWKGKIVIRKSNNIYNQSLVASLIKNNGKEQTLEWAKKLVSNFARNPKGNDRGTHMNISGGGILKNSPNPENAKKLLEFLLTKEAQQHIVNNTFEYPMIEGVEPHHLIKKMGENFKQDLKTKVEDYKKNQADALEVMLMSGWK